MQGEGREARDCCCMRTYQYVSNNTRNSWDMKMAKKNVDFNFAVTCAKCKCVQSVLTKRAMTLFVPSGLDYHLNHRDLCGRVILNYINCLG